MEKDFARPLADSPNIERDRRRSVSEMWTSLLCNIETDAAASVAGLAERYFCKHRDADNPLPSVLPAPSFLHSGKYVYDGRQRASGGRQEGGLERSLVPIIC